MHAILLLFRSLPNVGLQNFGMWGMYDLAKAHRSMQKSIANRRVGDWKASNGQTKYTTRLFHGPWKDPVGEHIYVHSYLECGTDSVFIRFLQVLQVFQRRKSDANKQVFDDVKFDM